MDALTPFRFGLRTTTGAVRLATWPARAVAGEVRDRLFGREPSDTVRFRPVPAPPRAPGTPTAAPPARPVPAAPEAPAPETPGDVFEELTGLKTIDDTPELVETEGAGSPGAELHVDPPWAGYERMSAADIVDRLVVADAAEKAVVRLYEQRHRRRRSILAAAV